MTNELNGDVWRSPSTSHLVEQCERLHLVERDRYTAQIARSDETREAAYRLRHDAYVSIGHMSDTRDGLLRDEFDDLQSSRTIVIYKGDRVVASVRVCCLDMSMLPSRGYSIPAANVFLPEIERALGTVRRFDRPVRAVEITKLVRSAECARSRGLTFMLFKLIRYIVLHVDADILFAAVCKHHALFYRRIGFNPISEPRLWPSLSGVTVRLLACPREMHEAVQVGLPRIVAARRNDPVGKRFMLGDRVSIFPDHASEQLGQDDRDTERHARPKRSMRRLPSASERQHA